MIDISSMPPDAQVLILSLQAQVSRLEHVVKLKDQQIRLLHLAKWGPKSEKLSDLQLSLLPEELVVSSAEIEQEASQPQEKKDRIPGPKKERSPHPGRNELPAHLERREQIIPCTPEECRCACCGGERPFVGYDTREELDCVPAEYFVNLVKREKRGSHCHIEEGVVTAGLPQRIVEKGLLSDNLIIEVLAAKFQQHQPVYRQSAMLLEDHGIDLSRQTLNQAILAAGELLIPVVKAMGVELKKGGYLQVDETRVPVQSKQPPEPEEKKRRKEKKEKTHHRAWLWQYSRPGGMVVFDFQMSRSRCGPREFLAGFRGKVQCDGYGVYDKLGTDIVYVGCWTHARRKFVDASKVAPNDPRPVAVLKLLAELYQVEEKARQEQMTPEERLDLRQKESVERVAGLKKHLQDLRLTLTPGSTLAKACDYTFGQWTRLEEYLKDGDLEIDNNWCEGGMRPIALGRKNWLHIGSESAGQKIAAIISMVETCRRLDIPLRAYLKSILPGLGNWPITKVGELIPSVWKAAQKS